MMKTDLNEVMYKKNYFYIVNNIKPKRKNIHNSKEKGCLVDNYC